MEARNLALTAPTIEIIAQEKPAVQLWQLYFDPYAALESVINHVEAKGSSRHERSTMRSYLSSLSDFARFMGARVLYHAKEDYTWDFANMGMPNRAMIEGYIAACLRRGLSSVSVERYMAAVRLFLRALESQEVIPQSGQDFMFIMSAQKQFQLAYQVKNPAPDKKTNRPALETHGSRLELDELDVLFSSFRPSFGGDLPDISTLAGKRDLALLYIGMTSGLRAAELGRLRLENIVKVDEENFSITVRGKGNKYDPVGIDAEGYALILQYVEAWNGRLAEGDERRISEDKPLFQPVLRGDHIPQVGHKWGGEIFSPMGGIHPRNISKLVERRVAAAIPKYQAKAFTAHDMRRTCAYIMRELGFEWDTIRGKLRHESIATTEKYVGKKLDLGRSNWTKKRRFNIPQDMTLV